MKPEIITDLCYNSSSGLVINFKSKSPVTISFYWSDSFVYITLMEIKIM
jgi:hypothetical protein